MNSIIEILAHFVTNSISVLGYPGVFLAMAIESACIPLPSEVIMPFSGFLAFQGTFNRFWLGLSALLATLSAHS
ncbi:MAG: hypothetical protein M0Z32_10060 [Actinomycetota bacterium]|nr:hypothetical protein [Actinomycetota bacterium]MDA8168065.1 hypothetical protein [Actinomycetota bacterium]